MNRFFSTGRYREKLINNIDYVFVLYLISVFLLKRYERRLDNKQENLILSHSLFAFLPY